MGRLAFDEGEHPVCRARRGHLCVFAPKFSPNHLLGANRGRSVDSFMQSTAGEAGEGTTEIMRALHPKRDSVPQVVLSAVRKLWSRMCANKGGFHCDGISYCRHKMILLAMVPRVGFLPDGRALGASRKTVPTSTRSWEGGRRIKSTAQVCS